MGKIKLILIITLTLLLITPALAADVVLSFEDARVTHSDIMVACLNASTGNYDYEGIFNTTSTGLTFTAPMVCTLTIKPSSANPLLDPVGFVQGGFAYLENNAYGLLFILLCIGLLIGLAGRHSGGRVRR